MDVTKNPSEIITHRDSNGNSYEITLESSKSTIKINLSNKSTFSDYYKEITLPELLILKPFVIIEELNEIHKIIFEGLKLDNSIKIYIDNNNLNLTFDCMYMKKYTNTFILTELPKTDKLIISEILKEIKTFKDNIITVNAENDLLSLELDEFNKMIMEENDKIKTRQEASKVVLDKILPLLDRKILFFFKFSRKNKFNS